MAKRTNHKRKTKYLIPEDEAAANPILEQLLELGKVQGYVTSDDILAAFPDAERDLDQLEEVYAALLRKTSAIWTKLRMRMMLKMRNSPRLRRFGKRIRTI